MTPWTRPYTEISVLRLGSAALRGLLSRELAKANIILDEWDFVSAQRVLDRTAGNAEPPYSSIRH
jgi:hypothetical protein